MLNRRHLRIKILQAFYAYYQSDNQSYPAGEKELSHSINKMYDMYLYLLLIFSELKRHASIKIEETKRSKYLENNPELLNLNFVNNHLISALEESSQLKSISKESKISWVGDVEQDLIKKIYKSISQSEIFKEILAENNQDFKTNKLHIANLFKNEICNHDLLHHFFEEKSIYWHDDLDHIASMVIKTLKSIEFDQDDFVLPLWKEDEQDYTIELFRKAVMQKEDNDKLLEKYTKNWESDRLAKMDLLLMNLAITEAKEFSSIPLKVTLNEYIEISKFYSTPKSNGFINGVLDKLFADLKNQGSIVKMGRGLIG
jgi:transcription antitermination protein NusB